MGTAYLPSPIDIITYDFFYATVPTSEYMFFLDVFPEEADRRIRQTRNRTEMFENLEELKRIRRKALYLASTSKWRIIDANRSPKEVEKEIENVLKLSF